MMLKAGDYYLHVHTAVPRGYPAQPLKIEITDSNLPDALVRQEAAKVADMAEKMAEYKMPQSDVGAAQARAGAGEAATSKTEALASKGKQTVVSFNRGQVCKSFALAVALLFTCLLLPAPLLCCSLLAVACSMCFPRADGCRLRVLQLEQLTYANILHHERQAGVPLTASEFNCCQACSEMDS